MHLQRQHAGGQDCFADILTPHKCVLTNGVPYDSNGSVWMLCHVLLHIGNLVMDLLLKTEGLFRQLASLSIAYTVVGWHGTCMAQHTQGEDINS